MELKRFSETPIFKEAGFVNSGATGTITSPVILSQQPTIPLHAASKSYIDNFVNNIPAEKLTTGYLASARLPALTGDVSATEGTSVITLNASGVVVGSYTKITVDVKGKVTTGASLSAADVPNLSYSKVTGVPTTLAGLGITDALAKGGGTLTGYLTLNNDPVNALHAATKQYADNKITNAPKFPTGDVMVRPSAVTPTGFLKCNGGQLSKTTYSALYAVIGDSFSYTANAGHGNPAHRQYFFNNYDNKDITNWTAEAIGLPVAITYSNYFVTKNRIYMMGGWSDATTGTTAMYYTNINADGTLAGWTSAGRNLAKGVQGAASFTAYNKVYVVGGSDVNGTSVSNVQVSTVDVNGVLSTWTNTTAFPVAFSGGVAFVTKDRVYVICNSTTTVYTSVINTDGTLAGWTTAPNSLVSAFVGVDVIVTKSRVYAFGSLGYIYVSTIAADGTIGAWTVDRSVPFTMTGTKGFLTNKRAYLVGGNAPSGGYNYVYSAPVNFDGTLGAFAAGTNYPVNIGDVGIVITNNYIYVIGGRNASPTYNIYRALFNGGSNDYSSYYNGTITYTDSNSFRLPDYTSKEVKGMSYFIKT